MPANDLLRSVVVHCPYCGEPLDIDVDCSVDAQNYIEDCQVCCRPIVMDVGVDVDGDPNVVTRSEDE